jgi:hypothetical protein
MHERPPRNLPWLEQLAIHIPGYGGYLDRGSRRAADRVLRDAIAERLADVQTRIEQTIRGLVEDRGRPQMSSEINVLERVSAHVDRIAGRLKSASSGTDAFYAARTLDAPKADSLHAFDMSLFERAQALVERFDATDSQHDFLANLEADLNEFERQLDERTSLLQGIQ